VRPAIRLAIGLPQIKFLSIYLSTIDSYGAFLAISVDIYHELSETHIVVKREIVYCAILSTWYSTCYDPHSTWDSIPNKSTYLNISYINHLQHFACQKIIRYAYYALINKMLHAVNEQSAPNGAMFRWKINDFYSIVAFLRKNKRKSFTGRRGGPCSLPIPINQLIRIDSDPLDCLNKVTNFIRALFLLAYLPIYFNLPCLIILPLFIGKQWWHDSLLIIIMYQDVLCTKLNTHKNGIYSIYYLRYIIM